MTAAAGGAGEAAAALAPFLALELAAWHGLPPLTVGELEAALGAAGRWEDALLGWEPARRAELPASTPSGGVVGWERRGEVVMVEALRPPPLQAVLALGEEPVVKHHEIRSDRGYVYEWLFAGRGLLVSVLDPWDGSDREAVRCRGIRPLAGPGELGTGLYRSFEDRMSW